MKQNFILSATLLIAILSGCSSIEAIGRGAMLGLNDALGPLQASLGSSSRKEDKIPIDQNYYNQHRAEIDAYLVSMQYEPYKIEMYRLIYMRYMEYQEKIEELQNKLRNYTPPYTFDQCLATADVVYAGAYMGRQCVESRQLYYSAADRKQLEKAGKAEIAAAIADLKQRQIPFKAMVQRMENVNQIKRISYGKYLRYDTSLNNDALTMISAIQLNMRIQGDQRFCPGLTKGKDEHCLATLFPDDNYYKKRAKQKFYHETGFRSCGVEICWDANRQ